MYGVGIRFIYKELLYNFTGKFQENKVKLRDNHLCPIKHGDSFTSCLQLKSLLGAFAYLRQVSISFTLSLCLPFRPSVRPTYISSAPTGRIFVKFYVGHFHQNLSRRSKFVYNRATIWESLHEDQRLFYCCRRHYIVIKVRSSSEISSSR